MSRLPLFTLPLLLLACGGSDDTPVAAPRVCAPGITQTCVCASGTGAQTCDASGTFWGECSCGTDTSTSSATGSDSGSSTSTSTSTGTVAFGVGCEQDSDCLPLSSYAQSEVFASTAKSLCAPVFITGKKVCTFTCEFNSDHGDPLLPDANPCSDDSVNGACVSDGTSPYYCVRTAWPNMASHYLLYTPVYKEPCYGYCGDGRTCSVASASGGNMLGPDLGLCY